MLTYTCNIAGGGTTLWEGTAFDCPSRFNEILLRHSLFGLGPPGPASGLCNDGAIAARSIGVEDNNFISELNVTVSTNLHDKTIQCSFIAVTIRIIGVSTIAVAISE